MKIKRTTNKEILRDWLIRNGIGSKTELAYKAKCSAHLIEKLLRPAYTGAPRPEIRFSICTVTGIPEKELFPEVNNETCNMA